MSKVGPIAVGAVAALLLLAALLVPKLLGAGSLPDDNTLLALQWERGLATSATLTVVIALAWLLLIFRAESQMEPYTPLLKTLCDEYGVDPEMDWRKGIGFQSASAGVLMEMRVKPGSSGSMTVRSTSRPGVRFMAMRKSGGMNDHAEWHPVETGRDWFLRSNEPVRAATLLTEFDFVVVLDDLFMADFVAGLKHDADGVEILLDLVEPESVDESLRMAAKAVLAIGRLNPAKATGTS